MSNVKLWNFRNSSISVRLLGYLHVFQNLLQIGHEEVFDVELLQLERNEVLLVKIPSPILVKFFCRKELEIRVD